MSTMESTTGAWLIACLMFAAPVSAELNLDLVESNDSAPPEARTELGVKVRAGGGQGGTAMHWMAFNGDAAGVSRLIISGADLDDRLKTGATPLHLAAYNGHVAVVRLLIEHGAPVNARTKAGITPVDWARRNGHEEVMKLLMAHGAKPSKASKARPASSAAVADPGGGVGAKPGFSPRRKTPLKYNLYLVPEESVVVNQGSKQTAPVQAETPVRQQKKGKAPPPEPKQVEAPARVKQEEKVPTPKETEEKIAVREQPKAKNLVQTKQATPTSAYRIQLGAFSTEQRARDAWDQFRKKHPGLLDSRELILDSTSVKGKSFYRVQTGPMSRPDAHSVCDRLKQAGQACAVMRRDGS